MTGWLRTRVYLLAAAIWVIGAIVFAFAQVVPRELLIPYMFFAIVVTIGGDLFHAPQTNGLPSALAPAALRGRYLALFSLSWGIGRTIAPGIVSVLLWLGTDLALGRDGADGLSSPRRSPCTPSGSSTRSRNECPAPAAWKRSSGCSDDLIEPVAA